MASISRIQVANFLSDGYAPGMEWAPLYRGETFRLWGQPSALQIDNGGGKTSLTEACLYLLTRSKSRRLRSRVEDRTSPIDKGWTHIRVEFVEKPHDEDVLQADLITLNPDDMPGITYVVGMCWSRTKEPLFYSYQGTLDDAPCFTREANGLVLIANDVFRKSVTNMPGAKWNRWKDQAEWLDEIRQFTNIEVLLQNVEFQLKGAGDYSAMINEVKPEADEAFDTAFFRQFVAPELLKHATVSTALHRATVGDQRDDEEDEKGFEDTILKTLEPAANALLDIGKRQRDLDDTKEALRKFKPVLEKAQEVVDNHERYEQEMSAIAQRGAIVHALAVTTPIPGIPVIPPGTQWTSDRRVLAALGHMLIDKKHGIVITDEGLAALIGVETGRVNQYARDKRIESLSSELQPIELQDVLKSAQDNKSSEANPNETCQPIENKYVLKKLGRGGRRYSGISYHLESALSLVSATANLAGAKTSGLSDVLTRAFGIAADEIDTNPYRKRVRKLEAALALEKEHERQSRSDYLRYQEEYETLTQKDRDAKENQVAYEIFMARKGEFPENHWESPIAAGRWATEEARRVEDERTEHIRHSSEHKDGYVSWQTLTEKHGPVPLAEVLESLNSQHTEAVDADANARRELKEANALLRSKRTELSNEGGNLDKAKNHLSRLEGLATNIPVFRKVFGEVDPMSLNPQADTQSELKAQQENDRLLREACTQRQSFLDLLPKTKLFVEVFGKVAPDQLTPSTNLRNHLQAISTEESVVTEHQPLVNALSLFRQQHHDVNIEEWLWRTAERRRGLTEERANNGKSISDLNGELEDLTAFGAADDRVYSRALKLLAEQDIVFERLHDLATSTVQEESRLEQCLTLFSAFLSAPVINSIEMATKATKLLEEARLTVPIFLQHALEAFLLEGDVRQVGEVAHALWVGRHTRQVAVLLNPSLVEEEKERIEHEINVLTERNGEIERLLEDISEESDAVKTALDAREAIRRDSERIHAETTEKLVALRANTSTFERQASIEAQEAISAMKRYILAGGETQYLELVETIIPDLESKRDRIQERLDTLASQTTEQALRALHAAKDFQREGGEGARVAAEEVFVSLDNLVKILADAVEDLQKQVEGSLNEDAMKAAEALRRVGETYALDKRDLNAAIDFEAKGLVTFMQEAPGRGQQLDRDLDLAQKRLQNIDFERAEHFLRITRSGELSLADRIAEALRCRNKAKENEHNASREITRIEGDIATIRPYMDMMHDMVNAIRVHHAKIAVFSEDIRQRMRSARSLDPEILGYAETVRIACLGEVPGASQEIIDAMWNLSRSVEDLEINTGELQKLAEARQRLLSDYVQRRDDFCARAKSGEIRGLNELEITAIAEAKTIEQLQRIQEAQAAIESQIKDLGDNLTKIRDAMESNKKASIDNLATLAGEAQTSLDILERVMKKTPSARFHVEATVVDSKGIEKIITGLLAQIEEKERAIRERGVILLNEELDRKTSNYRRLIHDTIYRQIFSMVDEKDNPRPPRVYFTHASIRGKDKVPFSDQRISTGQFTALTMMWLIKQADFAIARAAVLYGTAKERKAALRGAQRIMFFDGLFSNLSNEEYINDAFQGLGGVGENFQLIGLIHNRHYVNNKDIFPVHIVGRKMVANKSDEKRKRIFVSVEPWQDSNGMLLYTSAYKHDTHAAKLEHMNA